MRNKKDLYLPLLQAYRCEGCESQLSPLETVSGKRYHSRKPGFSKKTREHSQKRLRIEGMLLVGPGFQRHTQSFQEVGKMGHRVRMKEGRPRSLQG